MSGRLAIEILAARARVGIYFRWPAPQQHAKRRLHAEQPQPVSPHITIETWQAAVNQRFPLPAIGIVLIG